MNILEILYPQDDIFVKNQIFDNNKLSKVLSFKINEDEFIKAMANYDLYYRNLAACLMLISLSRIDLIQRYFSSVVDLHSF